MAKAWPAPEAGVTARASIEGTPLEMYVDDGIATVYSVVQNGAKVFEAAGVKFDKR